MNGLDSLTRAALRIHQEPCTQVDDVHVHRLLTERPREYVDHLHTMLQRIATGAATVELPSKQIFTDRETGGDFRVMPCVVRDGPRISKTVKVVGTNVVGRQVPDQITVGRALRLDPEENFVTHILDACLLSSARTGGCATVAIRALGGQAERIAVVGAGRVGYYAGVFAATLKGVRQIHFSDRLPGRASLVAAAVRRLVPSHVRVIGSEEWPGTADAVVLATLSERPVAAPDDIDAPVVVSVGADIETQREMGDGWCEAANLYTESLDSLEVGDLRCWRTAGLIRPDQVTTLLELLRRGPRPEGRRSLFVSTGSALFDNLTLDYVVRRLESARQPSQPLQRLMDGALTKVTGS